MSFSEWTQYSVSLAPHQTMRESISLPNEGLGNFSQPSHSVFSGVSSLHMWRNVNGGTSVNAAAMYRTGPLANLTTGRARVWWKASGIWDSSSMIQGFIINPNATADSRGYFAGFKNTTQLTVQKSGNFAGLLGGFNATGPHNISGGLVADTWYALEVAWETLTGPDRVRVRARAGVTFGSLVEAFDYTDSTAPYLTAVGLGVISVGGMANKEKYFDRLQVSHT